MILSPEGQCATGWHCSPVAPNLFGLEQVWDSLLASLRSISPQNCWFTLNVFFPIQCFGLFNAKNHGCWSRQAYCSYRMGRNHIPISHLAKTKLPALQASHVCRFHLNFWCLILDLRLKKHSFHWFRDPIVPPNQKRKVTSQFYWILELPILSTTKSSKHDGMLPSGND